MLAKRVESTYGRFIEKPGQDSNQIVDLDESSIPIQDQIENLRTKIALKARYNNVIREELDESQDGASTVLEKLFHETKCLRNDLIVALKAESLAVKHGLRSYEKLQLAMKDKTADVAIPWLMDGLSDLKKQLNREMDSLKLERYKMGDAELMIALMEKYPKPGSLPWEIFTALQFEIIENKTSDMKVRYEAATILNASYRNIKDMMQKDEEKFSPLEEMLEQQLKYQKSELSKFKQMLVDAIQFREEAEKSLLLTEHEGIENKRERRARMGKLKKEIGNFMEKKKSEMQEKMSKDILASNIFLYYKVETPESMNVTEEMLLETLNQIDDAELQTNLILSSMHINSVNKIPQRIKEVILLGLYLDSQLESLEKLRNVLVKEKAYLTLILMELSYTGSERVEKFQKAEQLYEENNSAILLEVQKAQSLMDLAQNEVFDIQLSVLASFSHIENDKPHHHPEFKLEDIPGHLRRLNHRIRRLAKQIVLIKESNLNLLQQDKETPVVVKPKPTPPHLLRVTDKVPSDIDSEEDEFLDPGVQTAQEIKKAGRKLVQRTIIRRGLH